MHQRAPHNEHRALNPPENHDIVLLFIGSMVQRSQAIIIEKDVVDQSLQKPSAYRFEVRNPASKYVSLWYDEINRNDVSVLYDVDTASFANSNQNYLSK